MHRQLCSRGYQYAEDYKVKTKTSLGIGNGRRPKKCPHQAYEDTQAVLRQTKPDRMIMLSFGSPSCEHTGLEPQWHKACSHIQICANDQPAGQPIQTKWTRTCITIGAKHSPTVSKIRWPSRAKSKVPTFHMAPAMFSVNCKFIEQSQCSGIFHVFQVEVALFRNALTSENG